MNSKLNAQKLKSILVTGANGQLGKSIKRHTSLYSGFNFVFVSREELDLSSSYAIAEFFADKAFDVIINCAAYTAVDKAESEPELADQINHQAVKTLAEIAKQNDTLLIHVSTDYVFNGESFKPYQEEQATDPQGVYGLTKLKGEQALLEIEPAGSIVRTSWVYSEFGNNFVKTMLRLGQERDQLGVIFDQVGTPTYAGDLAQAILEMLNFKLDSDSQVDTKMPKHAEGNGAVEIYHYSNEGVCSWYDFAKTIFELSNIDCTVNPIETKDYPTPAKRPHYSVLNKSKIKQSFGIEIPYWKDSLRKCLLSISKSTGNSAKD